MASKVLKELIQKAESLTVEEQLQLISHLVEKARQGYKQQGTRLSWKDLRGALPYPAFGEDAQQWVSRTRSESDERREKQWREDS